MRTGASRGWSAVLAVQFVTTAAPMAVLPFLFIHLQSLTASGTQDVAFWTAVAAAAPACAAVVATPLWGRLAARRSLAGLLALSCLLSAASYGLQAWARTPELFASARLLQGAAGSGIIPLLAVERMRRTVGRGYVNLQQAFAAGCLAGPLLGGLASDYAALPILLGSAAALCIPLSLACAILLQGTVSRNAAITAEQVTSRPSKKDAVVILAASIGTAGAFGFAPFFAAWAIERIGSGISTATIGAIHAAGWLAAIAILPVWGRAIERLPSAASLQLSLMGMAVTLGLLALPGSVLGIVVLRILQGGTQAGLAPSLYALVGRSEQPEQSIAAARTALTLGQILGPAICGLALPWGGMNAALLAAALLPLIGLILLSTGYRS